MRTPLAISTERLRTCLQEQYGLLPATLDFLPLGLDYSAGVYRLVSEQGTSYLLKIRSGPLYEPGCLVPAYLYARGVTSVVAPLPTREQALWAGMEDWTVIVYPFLEGETSWGGMTDEQWFETGAIFKQIHSIIPPGSSLGEMRRETFDPTGYVESIRRFESLHLHNSSGERASQHLLRSAWIEKQATIHAVVETLEKLAEVLQRRNLPLVICHADLHPANLLRDPRGRVYVIDWDEVMLAPRERDFLFVKESPADSRTLPGAPTFFQGYGQTEIDWIALTYYRSERVIQDVIACAENVCLNDDLSEESSMDEALLFQNVLARDGEIDAAIHAISHLSSDLTLPLRDARIE